MQCALCQQERDLCDSHIIPSFVFAWLKESSATGYFRFGPNINLRVQDGWKPKLLCKECEKEFNKSETPFAAKMFYPLHQDEALRLSRGPWFRYDSWCMKFAASVCWRILVFFDQFYGLKHFSAEQQQAVAAALATWRSFLLGETEKPGPHELHMIMFDCLADHTCGDLPKNFNRYLARGVECDVVRGEKSAFVYAKMCRLLVIGFIQKDPKAPWSGTKLRGRKGEIGGKNYVLPSALLKYICGRAQRMAELEGKMSAKQRQKIDAEYEKQKDRALNSETLSVSLHDYEMFGAPEVADTKGS
jgi:hypothetical protein